MYLHPQSKENTGKGSQISNYKSIGGLCSKSSLKKHSNNSIKNKDFDHCGGIFKELTKDEQIRPALHGVLSVTVKSARFFESNLHSDKNIFCSISIRNITKKTKTKKIFDKTLKFDQTKHFSLMVPRNKRHPYNVKVKIKEYKLIASSYDLNITPVASLSFHLHDIIQASPTSGIFDFWLEEKLVGNLDLELTFNYGSFGYGSSEQLKENDIDPLEMIQFSLFPKLIPPLENCESNSGVFIVQATPHPSFIPFNNRAHLSYGKECGATMKTMEETMYKPDLLLHHMGSLKKIRDEIQEAISTDTTQQPIQLNNKNYLNFVKPCITFSEAHLQNSETNSGAESISIEKKKNYFPQLQSKSGDIIKMTSELNIGELGSEEDMEEEVVENEESSWVSWLGSWWKEKKKIQPE
ncbi:hypothetical protein HDU92_005427 [Lobulomyces angularis]|nr:hypothetical protein HDU92_005427 [Lobulomyces angularis]